MDESNAGAVSRGGILYYSEYAATTRAPLSRRRQNWKRSGFLRKHFRLPFYLFHNQTGF